MASASGIEHPVLGRYVLVMSVIWLIAGVVQLCLWAAGRVARVGRLTYFFVAVLLGGGGSMTALLVPTVTPTSRVFTIVGAVWLAAFLLYLGEFVGLVRFGGRRGAGRPATR